jgi:hypothetical protein
VPVVTAIEEDTSIPPGPGIGGGLDGARRAVVGVMLDTQQKLHATGHGEGAILDAIWKVAVDGLGEAVVKAGAARYLRHCRSD